MALDPEKEVTLGKKWKERNTFVLPDGHFAEVKVERFLAPETFFNPNRIRKKYDSLDDVVCNVIKNCDADLCRALFVSIVPRTRVPSH